MGCPTRVRVPSLSLHEARSGSELRCFCHARVSVRERRAVFEGRVAIDNSIAPVARSFGDCLRSHVVGVRTQDDLSDAPLLEHPVGHETQAARREALAPTIPPEVVADFEGSNTAAEPENTDDRAG